MEAEEAKFSDMEADAQQMADSEKTHRSRGRELASERASLTLPAKKTRTCEQYAGSSGDPPAVQAQRLSALALHIPRDTELLALTQRAEALLQGKPRL